ncbi:4'-phosphopantetheinyl transferase superfamily protein [Shimia sp. R9_3]|uniref:4'-phosphopantetheinyl transferase family protein n=1 Tax=Shimia sp. R9_3 TaxID=2821113 RepID=UPI001ADCE065|nr:4'-phosphopantetheinyl transferase superfamily protein [Shimia sp. R9_3]MBO9400973.1 4'-phosphopantetheinyl transferase superfamily protein [Shimia sp. R9_3]
MRPIAPSLIALKQGLAQIAPKAVAVAVSDPRGSLAVVWPEEAPAIAKAVPARRREFAAGRHAARMAMRDLGVAEQAIPAGQDRAPIWPEGLTGSISHDETSCIALLGLQEDFHALGVDVEPVEALPANVIDEVCTQRELDGLLALPADLRARDARRLFCAKEAVFKAQYPLTGCLFDFKTLEITWPETTTHFTACFTRDVGSVPANATLCGQVGEAGGHMFALVAIGARAATENAEFPFCAMG